MVRLVNINRKKTIKHILILIILIVVTVIGALLYIRKKADNCITMAQAAKMIACANADEQELADAKQDGYWYTVYVDYVNANGLLKVSNPNTYVKYDDIVNLMTVLKVDSDQFSDLAKKSGYISRSEFAEFYMKVLGYMKYGDQISEVEMGIAGTPSNLEAAGEWEVYTTKGRYQFRGLILDDDIDKTVKVIVKSNEILAIENTVSDDVTYRNVWIKNSNNSKLNVNVYGADREFTVSGLSENVESVLADLELVAGKVKSVSVKTDTINGKVLSVTKDYVEIEGYGKVDLDEYFMIYDINNGCSVKTYQDIVVGYSLQNFIVADGRICGAVISKPLNIQNIRVIIKNTGFESIFHDNVQLTSDSSFTVSYGDTVEKHNAGEVISLDQSSAMLGQGRVSFVADNNKTMRLLTVKRSQGNPCYEGKIEVSSFDDGLVIVNDIDIEQYLKKVVPSEMPVSFGVEALKVQAVCARSYAYKQLTNSYYSMYGAHVDDSTLFQVYNNTEEHEESNAAITQTRGQVLTYQGDVIQTYYYSTSCGVTTDVGLWGSDPTDYPYFSSTDVSRGVRNLNLTDEATFDQFIQTKDEKDYDYNCALYRWELSVSREELSNSFNGKLAEKYLSAPSKILTLNADGKYTSTKINTVGTISGITVNKRATGGAATSVTVKGSQATVRIDSESLIRGLFGVSTVTMTTNTGTTVMSSLPSTFCMFEGTYTSGNLTGFKIIGGGYGHGIGMSQNAVNSMVKDSMNYQQILQFFYKGTELTSNGS